MPAPFSSPRLRRIPARLRPRLCVLLCPRQHLRPTRPCRPLFPTVSLPLSLSLSLALAVSSASPVSMTTSTPCPHPQLQLYPHSVRVFICASRTPSSRLPPGECDFMGRDLSQRGKHVLRPVTSKCVHTVSPWPLPPAAELPPERPLWGQPGRRLSQLLWPR